MVFLYWLVLVVERTIGREVTCEQQAEAILNLRTSVGDDLANGFTLDTEVNLSRLAYCDT